ncbi:SDR family NAD(P)-dependent oxidoreductase [Actinosynnema sp. NPDC047251]|uniref:Putative short chain dehydrogenase n=1 Tax=Saccharothrix espanaensis (strain ATCC 51144 / DSM 44229 / JCM 9112 / NBRC 15066 / NRRL 15764) TaxID=1179773 RepID=K0K131_SACES|nr:SDR family NAD(P)-dependent oxidoreductase [Saccharothrix espanaensis]CCH32046.1 putative short chain dehydrogenase [Saccharothrix espanaensis DSM 44229]
MTRISSDGRVVVVTGASSGLGRECALHLDRLGVEVRAGVRREADGRALEAASTGRLRALPLDVTDPDSIRDAVKAVRAVWGVVNNAGTCVPAPVECLSTQRLREQLEINVVGSVAVTRAFLPLVRESRGRVVNVSSGLGRVASPYLGAYAASQFAKEALSDALRRELRPFGVAVSVVEPGAIRTPIWDKIAAQEAAVDDAEPEVADLYRRSFRRFLAANDKRARSSRTTPRRFAEAVEHALLATRPRIRYRVGPDARLAALIARLLPDAAVDAAFAKTASR